MADLLSITKKDIKHTHEEYDRRIKSKVERVENNFRIYTAKKLEALFPKALSYVSSKVNIQKAQSPSIFGHNDFNFDYNLITPVIGIGVDFQNDRINEILEKYGANTKNINYLLGIDFSPANVKFINLISERKGFLQETLEKTTIDGMNRVITDGISKGLSYQEIANNLTSTGLFSEERAAKIARSEANWALNEGTRQYVETLGVAQYQISPAIDACPLCLDAQKMGPYSIGEKDIIPIHPNCRCTLISVIPDEWLRATDDNLDEIKSAEIFVPQPQQVYVNNQNAELGLYLQREAETEAKIIQSELARRSPIIERRIVRSGNPYNMQLEQISRDSSLSFEQKQKKVEELISSMPSTDPLYQSIKKTGQLLFDVR